MTTVLLVRHAENDYVGHTFAGWTPGVHLNEAGLRQAERLAERLSRLPIRAIYSSPLERARETAEPIARRLGLEVSLLDAVGEIRLGEWTLRSIDSLRNDPAFRRFNEHRSTARIPGGETMLEVQVRMAEAFEEIHRKHPDDIVLVVSHGDPIRAILAHYLGMPLDFIDRIEAGTASVSVIQLHEWGPVVLRLNDTGDLSASSASLR